MVSQKSTSVQENLNNDLSKIFLVSMNFKKIDTPPVFYRQIHYHKVLTFTSQP